MHPGCVLTPSTAREVSVAMSIIKTAGCQFSVKSGGHNANPGANSIEEGVSIDLQRLNSTQLAADRKSVSLGTGITWGNAYKAFESEGIAFPGGICEDVGVGGLAVGGGQSIFQASKGWVVDNIIRYEIVLANGKIATADEKKNPDLFKALKGGNTNFGIVTNVEIAAFDFGTMWGGEMILNLNGPESTHTAMVDNLTHAMVNFVENNNHDLDTGLQVITTNLRNGAQLVDLSLTNTANIGNPPAIKDFLSAPNKLIDTTRHTTLATMAHVASEAVPKGFRYITASLTIKNDYKTLREIWDMNDAVFQGLPVQGQVDWMVSLIPQPKVQKSHAAARGGNMLGLETADDEIVLWLLSRWNNPSLDDMVSDARQTFLDKANQIAKANGADSPFVYINYAGYNQNPLCGYGKENVDFLRQVANKYDPSGVFQKQMPGGFKIGNVQC
ncbi:hypothetical protein VHEMI05474 [[Torrubiella] hemipterigena]|nr:hypothetical protein VHEMI05474 [[Torrubiella] hemipterigena]